MLDQPTRTDAADNDAEAADASRNTPLARLRRTLSAAGLADDARITPAGAGIASPMRLGTEWAGFVVDDGATRLYGKVLHPDMRPVVDFARTEVLSRAAAQAGLAPAVRFAHATEETLLFEHLDAPEWRWARIDDLDSAAGRETLFDLLRRLHATEPTGDLPRLSPADDIARLRALCEADGAPLPADRDWIGACVELALNALLTDAPQMRLLHGDLIASNLMIASNGALKLVDFDSAGVFDPWFDVATALNELCQFDDEWRSAIASWTGRCSDADYARCRLYGMIHDWRWTLWGLWAGAMSRRPLEFYKVGQWTLLRCRQTLRDPRFESWLRYVREDAR